MSWWLCPNDPPCPHGAIVHDVEDYEDPSPTCCVEGCSCGHPVPAVAAGEQAPPGGAT